MAGDAGELHGKIVGFARDQRRRLTPFGPFPATASQPIERGLRARRLIPQGPRDDRVRVLAGANDLLELLDGRLPYRRRIAVIELLGQRAKDRTRVQPP